MRKIIHSKKPASSISLEFCKIIKLLSGMVTLVLIVFFSFHVEASEETCPNYRDYVVTNLAGHQTIEINLSAIEYPRNNEYLFIEKMINDFEVEKKYLISIILSDSTSNKMVKGRYSDNTIRTLKNITNEQMNKLIVLVEKKCPFLYLYSIVDVFQGANEITSICSEFASDDCSSNCIDIVDRIKDYDQDINDNDYLISQIESAQPLLTEQCKLKGDFDTRRKSRSELFEMVGTIYASTKDDKYMQKAEWHLEQALYYWEYNYSAYGNLAAIIASPLSGRCSKVRSLRESYQKNKGRQTITNDEIAFADDIFDRIFKRMNYNCEG